jgi:hypothetical protein
VSLTTDISPRCTISTNGALPLMGIGKVARSIASASALTGVNAARSTISPSMRTTVVACPPTSLFARSAIASKTGCTSEGERAITFRMSAVAVCRSNASFVSLNSRTFSMAMTAWSATGLQKSDLLFAEGVNFSATKSNRANRLPFSPPKASFCRRQSLGFRTANGIPGGTAHDTIPRFQGNHHSTRHHRGTRDVPIVVYCDSLLKLILLAHQPALPHCWAAILSMIANMISSSRPTVRIVRQGR